MCPFAPRSVVPLALRRMAARPPLWPAVLLAVALALGACATADPQPAPTDAALAARHQWLLDTVTRRPQRLEQQRAQADSERRRRNLAAWQTVQSRNAPVQQQIQATGWRPSMNEADFFRLANAAAQHRAEVDARRVERWQAFLRTQAVGRRGSAGGTASAQQQQRASDFVVRQSTASGQATPTTGSTGGTAGP